MHKGKPDLKKILSIFLLKPAGFGILCGYMGMKHDAVTHSSFLRLFLKHERELKLYARHLLPTWDSVQEVMQESSVVLWQKLDQLTEEEQFLPWAKVVVRYEALKCRQKVARDKLCFREDIYDLLAEEDDQDALDLERERLALASCLQELTAAKKDLVLLPYLGHGAVKELSEKMGRTPNSLYKKIARIRENLTSCIRGKLNSATYLS